MDIVRNREELDTALARRRGKGNTISLVPTMGALHDGHLSLVKCARGHADCVIVSIFVNPTQFGPGEDFDTYPQNERDDIAKLEKADADIVFLPAQDVLYPGGYETHVTPGPAAQGMESDFRPGHFEGVVNVVHCLFSAVTPDIAIFGEKDFQQLQVIREMVETLDLPVTVIGAPIVRDAHGLALSSRNAYLSARELKTARKLNTILRRAAHTRDCETARAELLSCGFDAVDYVEIRWERILSTVRLGKTRLLDNMPLV